MTQLYSFLPRHSAGRTRHTYVFFDILSHLFCGRTFLSLSLSASHVVTSRLARALSFFSFLYQTGAAASTFHSSLNVSNTYVLFACVVETLLQREQKLRGVSPFFFSLKRLSVDPISRVCSRPRPRSSCSPSAHLGRVTDSANEALARKGQRTGRAPLDAVL